MSARYHFLVHHKPSPSDPRANPRYFSDTAVNTRVAWVNMVRDIPLDDLDSVQSIVLIKVEQLGDDCGL